MRQKGKHDGDDDDDHIIIIMGCDHHQVETIDSFPPCHSTMNVLTSSPLSLCMLFDHGFRSMLEWQSNSKWELELPLCGSIVI